ncbi:MAG TPA: hydroxymethylbilane synthase [Verrucomicrobiae bacterium]|nr:hydroxymethylbilane synthase [Verrucomicrobiae bacterium]
MNPETQNLKPKTIFIATRGSDLALAQANMVLERCSAAFPEFRFELKIIKTTGDKLQTASLAQENKTLPKGLFTKDLELALLNGDADLAVHSLKDLPTELPDGLKLGAVTPRADVRDVLIYRDAAFLKNPKLETRNPESETLTVHPEPRGFAAHLQIGNLPDAAVVGTSSTRRKAQLIEQNPKLAVVEIRGNVVTRMHKLAENPALDAIVLALAGITRLNFQITPEGKLVGPGAPEGLLATILESRVMLPCVGQGAIGIEIRANDEQIGNLCERLNDFNTFQCVTAERAFLAAMGGGCQSPVGAHAEILNGKIRMRAVSFVGETTRRGEVIREISEAVELGQQMAAALK